MLVRPNPYPEPNPNPNPEPNPTVTLNRTLTVTLPLPLPPTRSDHFETFLATKYPTSKRFGLEGCEVRTCPCLPTSPYTSLHLPTSPYISLYLPTSPYISLEGCEVLIVGMNSP